MFVVERLEDLARRRVLDFFDGRPEMYRGAHDREMWDDVESRSRLAQFGKQEERQQKGRDHVCGDGGFVVFCPAVLFPRDPRILNHNVEPRQGGVAPLGKCQDRCIACQIQWPDLDCRCSLFTTTTAAGGGGGGREDLLLGGLAFGLIAAGEDQVLDVETEEVLARVEAEASVRTRHDDGAAAQVGAGDRRRLEELASEELANSRHGFFF